MVIKKRILGIQAFLFDIQKMPCAGALPDFIISSEEVND